MKLSIDIHFLKSFRCDASCNQSALTLKQLTAEVKDADAHVHLDITLTQDHKILQMKCFSAWVGRDDDSSHHSRVSFENSRAKQ